MCLQEVQLRSGGNLQAIFFEFVSLKHKLFSSKVIQGEEIPLTLFFFSGA